MDDRNVESLEFYGYHRPFEVVDTHNNGHSLVVSGFNHHQQAVSGKKSKQNSFLCCSDRSPRTETMCRSTVRICHLIDSCSLEAWSSIEGSRAIERELVRVHESKLERE